jgi:aspartyl-tRNA(Asn)/glutamyl-tRNA(Gln) amidotransferase subunit C
MDRKTVEKVAEVARLRLTEAEAERFSRDMTSILEAFRVLEKIDTRDVRPTFQPVESGNVMRNDEIEPSISQEEALAGTRNKEEGHFKGPRVI